MYVAITAKEAAALIRNLLSDQMARISADETPTVDYSLYNPIFSGTFGNVGGNLGGTISGHSGGNTVSDTPYYYDEY